MQLFGGQFCTLHAFNLTSRAHVDMKCACCTCPELDVFKNYTDIKDLECVQQRKNFDKLSFAVLTVFQVPLV